MQTPNGINSDSVLIDILLDNGYKKVTYSEQNGLVTYAKEIDIIYFQLLTKKLDVVICNETLEGIYNDFGTIVVIEYIPSQNVVQWCNSHKDGEQSPDYTEYESFDLSKTKEDYQNGMDLLQQFFQDGPEVITIYMKNGFLTRDEYLNSLVDEYDLPFDTIKGLSTFLGESEDFDGLLVGLEAEKDRIETDFGYGE